MKIWAVRYGITLDLIGEQAFLEMSQDDYLSVTSAQKNIWAMLSIEEKFDALLQNYAEYERELLSIGVERSLFRELKWFTMIGDLHLLNRRLGNLLTMARVYVDHTSHDLNEIYGKASNTSDALKQAFRGCYERSFGYRVMEALRNHMQHHSFPIGGISLPSQWMGDVTSDKSRLRTRVHVYLDPGRLRLNNKFKPGVLEELEHASDETRDVTFLLRAYIEQLGSVHEVVRLLASDYPQWKSTIEGVLHRYEDLTGEKRWDAVAVVKDNERDKWMDRMTIFTEPCKRLEWLRKNNGLLTNLQKRYVSNETS